MPHILSCVLVVIVSLLNVPVHGQFGTSASATCSNDDHVYTRIFFDNFEDPTNPAPVELADGVVVNWSNYKTYDGAGRGDFLGQFFTGDDGASLSLGNLPGHSEVEVVFELIVSGSWDGNGNTNPGVIGPDNVILELDDVEVFRETFCLENTNIPGVFQSYPPDDGETDVACHTGSTIPGAGNEGVDITGAQYSGFEPGNFESSYTIAMKILHNDNTIDLEWLSTLQNGVNDEAMLLDDIQVYACLGSGNDEAEAEAENDNPGGSSGSNEGLSPTVMGLIAGSAVVVVGGAFVFWGGRSLDVGDNDDVGIGRAALAGSPDGDDKKKSRRRSGTTAVTGVTGVTKASEVLPRIQRDIDGAGLQTPVPSVAGESTGGGRRMSNLSKGSKGPKARKSSVGSRGSKGSKARKPSTGSRSGKKRRGSHTSKGSKAGKAKKTASVAKRSSIGSSGAKKGDLTSIGGETQATGFSFEDV